MHGTMRRAGLGFCLLAACDQEQGELSVYPQSVDFGTVNFMEEMPGEGYAQQSIDVMNVGLADLNVWLPSYDQVHMCLEGFEASEGTIELPTISPESRYILKLAVCGYDQYGGELESEIRGDIQLLNDGVDPLVELPYSFTPVRDQGSDTGR